MDMRNLLAGAAVATALLMAGTPPANAGPEIPLGGYTGPVTLKFYNYESFISTAGTCGTTPTVSCVGGAPAIGDVNFGIFELTSIQAGIQTLWSSGTGGQYLLGVFSGITVSGITNPGGSSERTTNTGGTFNLYMVPTADGLFVDPGLAGYTTGGCNDLAGLACYNGITNAIGALPVLTMSLTTGQGLPLDSLSTLIANLDGTLNPPTGSAASYASITGDPQFGSSAHLQDNFCPNGATGCAPSDTSDFALASSDPITGTVVPEPASMAILGGGLLLLHGFRVRRQKKTVSRP